MKYAIISDIHGNYIAMQNVLKDAIKNRADAFIFVGDYLVSAPWPREVVETLQNMKHAFIVKGNEEQYLHIPEGNDGQFEISRWSKRQLSAEQISWLDDLPERLDISDEICDIHIAHKSEEFIGTIECEHFHPYQIANRHYNEVVLHEKMLSMINTVFDKDKEFLERQKQLPEGIYIFGHSHIQWHKEIAGHWYINPGSCGLPMDCEQFGAPYTLLTVDANHVSVEERRVRYDVYDLIEKVKKTSQYKEAYVWSELTFKEWLHSRDHVDFFLEFAEDYARTIGDDRRPIEKDTWEEAFVHWDKENGEGRK